MSAKGFLRKLLAGKKRPDENVRTILIVDDDPDLRDNLKDILEGEGYMIYRAATSTEASRMARDVQPWVALVDLKLPDGTGMALLSDLKQVNPECVCILMTAYADVESAIQAIEKGVFYYLRKPLNPAEMVELVDLAFDTIRLKREKEKSDQKIRQRNQELEETLERLRKIIAGHQP